MQFENAFGEGMMEQQKVTINPPSSLDTVDDLIQFVDWQRQSVMALAIKELAICQSNNNSNDGKQQSQHSGYIQSGSTSASLPYSSVSSSSMSSSISISSSISSLPISRY